jgi:flagellar motor protein MotB
MANDIVNTYSDALFNLYQRLNVSSQKGSQNGWPYCQTETGLRVFPEAAEPHISGTTQSVTSSSSPSPPPRLQGHPIWLQTFWPVGVGALVVICCVLALAWQAHWQAPAIARPQPHDTEIAKTWREAAQQLVESLLAEVCVLNSNQAALATSQVQIGAGLAKLGNLDTQLAALASTQASASRGLAAAQTALAQETTNLVASLRQTFQQGLAEATSQSRADTEKLQTQIAEVAASHKALLDRLSGSTNVPNLAFALLGVRTKIYGNSILLTFDDGLFLRGTGFKPDAKSRLQAVARALAQVSTPLRIDVIGCADDDRVFKRWTARFEESLALERASAVVNYFIELGLFAPKRLAALSSRGTDRPFPSDTVQNRAKNRTAVLRISTEEKPLAGYDEPAP